MSLHFLGLSAQSSPSSVPSSLSSPNTNNTSSKDEDSTEVLLQRLYDLTKTISRSAHLSADQTTAMHTLVEKMETIVRRRQQEHKAPPGDPPFTTPQRNRVGSYSLLRVSPKRFSKSVSKLIPLHLSHASLSRKNSSQSPSPTQSSRSSVSQTSPTRIHGKDGDRGGRLSIVSDVYRMLSTSVRGRSHTSTRPTILDDDVFGPPIMGSPQLKRSDDTTSISTPEIFEHAKAGSSIRTRLTIPRRRRDSTRFTSADSLWEPLPPSSSVSDLWTAPPQLTSVHNRPDSRKEPIDLPKLADTSSQLILEYPTISETNSKGGVPPKIKLEFRSETISIGSLKPRCPSVPSPSPSNPSPRILGQDSSIISTPETSNKYDVPKRNDGFLRATIPTRYSRPSFPPVLIPTLSSPPCPSLSQELHSQDSSLQNLSLPDPPLLDSSLPDPSSPGPCLPGSSLPDSSLPDPPPQDIPNISEIIANLDLKLTYNAGEQAQPSIEVSERLLESSKELKEKMARLNEELGERVVESVKMNERLATVQKYKYFQIEPFLNKV